MTRKGVLVATLAAMLADANHKSAAYAGLAQSYAREYETWLALHSQFAADLSAARAALLEGGLSPQGLEETVAQSLALSQIDPSQPHLSALQARDAVARVLPDENKPMWRSRLASLDYLSSLPPANPQGLLNITAERLNGADIESYLVGKRQEQEASREAAIESWDAGDSWGAIEGTYAADLACFEGWLVQRSRTIGDDNLVQAELIWTLACAALEQINDMPEDYDAAVAMVRSRLAWAVGPDESAALAYALDA